MNKIIPMIKNLLLQPYPASDGVGAKWRTVAFFGLFVFLFLLVFQPFGLANNIPHKTWIIVGYGLITALSVWLANFALPLLVPGFFRERNWRLWKELVFSLLVMVFIAFFNLAYTFWVGFIAFSLQAFFYSLFMTLSLGILPVAGIILINYHFQLRRNLHSLERVKSKVTLHSPPYPKGTEEEITLTEISGSPALNVSIQQVVHIEAAQNYVLVHYWGDEAIQKKIFRNSLKNISNQLESQPLFVQTHRSHIVNTGKILQISGNAQGYQLEMEGLSETIPVSRSRIAAFEQRFQVK